MVTRERIWEIVEAAKPGDQPSRLFDSVILFLIFTNVIAVVVGSVPSVNLQHSEFLANFELLSVSVFTIEYLARIWACTADARYSQWFWGRLRFARRPLSVIDFLAILPFFLPFLGLDLRSLRIIRLLRFFRLAKIGRYYSSLNLIGKVVVGKKEELILTFSLMAMLLIVSASILFYLEGPAQPDKFSSIPATMWWAVATLTTVGYGDMYPTTEWGKVFAGLISIIGIGMFALPTGILGAGFVEEVQKSRVKEKHCPHCGRIIS